MRHQHITKATYFPMRLYVIVQSSSEQSDTIYKKTLIVKSQNLQMGYLQPVSFKMLKKNLTAVLTATTEGDTLSK